MEPTPIIPGETQNLPVPLTPEQVEPYERAATLMAGCAPGGQGEVRVWAPRKQQLWREIGTTAVGVAAGVAVGEMVNALYHGRLDLATSLFQVVYWTTLISIPVLIAFRRPLYVTTDGNGIGIKTWTGSYACPWTDVLALQDVDIGYFLKVRGKSRRGEPDYRLLNLAGYPEPLKNELLSLIKRNAQLQPARKSNRNFVRRAVELSGTENVPALPPSASE